MTNRVILLGVLATGPATMAGTYSFQIAIDNLSDLPSQVIVQTGGRIVAAVDSNLLYKSPTESLPFPGPSRTFSNISFTGTGSAARVTYFATDPQGQLPYRLYQQQVPETPETPGAAQSVPIPGTFTFEGREPIRQQTSSAGWTVFSGHNGTNEVVVGGTGDGTTTLADDATHSGPRLSAFNGTGTFDDPDRIGRKIPVGESAVFLGLRDGDTTRSIVQMTDANTAPVLLVNASHGPRTLLGTADGAVMYTTASDVVIKTAGGTHTRSYSGPNPANGIMTDSGKAAFLTADDGGTLRYFDGSDIATVATNATGLTDPSLHIVQLLHTAAPMVNDSGWVAFFAMVARDGDEQKSLLLWHPTAQSTPALLAREGDELEIDGVSRTIASIGGGEGSIGADWSVFKDGLSDDNWLGVGIMYATKFDEQGHVISGNGAVIVTQLVPEPGTLAWLAVSGAMAARRRRNRYI